MLAVAALGKYLGLDAEVIDTLWKGGLGLGLFGLRTANKSIRVSKMLGGSSVVSSVFLLVPLAGFAALTLPGCGGPVVLTPEGCVMREVERDGQRYSLGACLGADGEVERVVVEWESQDGVNFQATQYRDERGQLIRYRAGTGSWLAWSSETGIFSGPLPPEVVAGILEARSARSAEVTNSK